MRVGLIVRRDDALRASVGAAAAVEKVAADELIARCVESRDRGPRRPPTSRAGIDTVAAHVAIRRNAAEDDDRRRAARTTHLVGRNFDENF